MSRNILVTSNSRAGESLRGSTSTPLPAAGLFTGQSGELGRYFLGIAGVGQDFQIIPDQVVKRCAVGLGIGAGLAIRFSSADRVMFFMDTHHRLCTHSKCTAPPFRVNPPPQPYNSQAGIACRTKTGQCRPSTGAFRLRCDTVCYIQLQWRDAMHVAIPVLLAQGPLLWIAGGACRSDSSPDHHRRSLQLLENLVSGVHVQRQYQPAEPDRHEPSTRR